jgi:hypothetical protein
MRECNGRAPLRAGTLNFSFEKESRCEKNYQGTGTKSEQKGRSRIWIRQFVQNTRRMLSPHRSRLISLFQIELKA